MSKIFEFNANKGSYLDQVSKAQGTNSNGEFKQTEKGLAWLGNGVNSKITLGQSVILGTVFSFTCIIKINNDIVDYQAIAGNSNASYPLAVRKSNNSLYCHDGTNFVTEIRQELFDNNWHIVTVVRNNTSVYFYIDGIIGSEKTLASNNSISIDRLFERNKFFQIKGYCSSIRIDNIILSQQEINNLYKDFLRQKPLGTSIHKKDFPIKPTDLSRFKDDGLVAAYNMIPSSGGVLTDISGNGNNGTISGAISCKNGMKFDGINDYINIPLISPSGVKTLNIRLKLNSTSDNQRIFYGGSPFYLQIISGVLRFYNGDTAIDITSPDLLEHTYSFVISATKINIYKDGIKVIADRDWVGVNGFSTLILGQGGGIRFTNMEAQDIQIYNRALSEQEAKDYHNQFVKPVILSDYKYDAVGNFPKNYIKGTGTYEIVEDTNGEKSLKCTSAGTCAIQSKTAYGEWEFDYYHAQNAYKYLEFINNNKNNVNSNNSYGISPNSNNGLRLRKANVTLFETVNDYIKQLTWYRIRITRTTDGEFTIYIRSDEDSNFTNWTLVDTTGGSGTNPVVDNTYTTSKYQVFDLDTNDELGDIQIWNGIKQI